MTPVVFPATFGFALLFAAVLEGFDLLAALDLGVFLGLARELGFFINLGGVEAAFGDPFGEALPGVFRGVSSGGEELTISAS
eukprot:s140_g35.t1